MRVLLVNKFYRPSGGAERYVQLWGRLLRQRGHEVIPFAMRDPRNWPSPYEHAFAPPVDFNRAGGIGERVSAALHSIYSFDARRRLSALIRDVRPDVAHVHSYCYQLTGSVLAALRAAGVPVIQTAHEYKHVCPNQRLYDQRAHRICEACRGGRWLAPVLKRCIKASLAASTVGCVEHLVDRLMGLSRRGIRHVIAPSGFMRRKMIAFGWPGGRVTHVPNFVFPDDFDPSWPAEPYFLFLGRLVRHKGALTLIEAVTAFGDARLVIAGDGPLRPDVEQRAHACGNRVRLVGFVTGQRLRELLQRCLAVVVPSEWYENCPYVVLEAMAAGQPVIGARIGGIPELVRHGHTGLLSPPGDGAALVENLRRVWQDRRGAAEMGQAGRRLLAARYGSDEHYRAVFDLVRGLV